MSVWRRYGFLWITGAFFLFSLILHWLFGWLAYVDEQTAHGQAVAISGYMYEMSRDTFENWQSEFLQLMWQVAGLAFLLFVGSPQSKEEDDRLEGKLDAILRAVSPDKADAVIAELGNRYPDPKPEGKHLLYFVGVILLFLALTVAVMLSFVALVTR